MKILGIDPGYGRLGYGIISKRGSQLIPITYGLIETTPQALPARLREIHQKVYAILTEHDINCLAAERLLFARNTTTAIDVAKAQGCVLLAAEERGIPTFEYSPPEIKQSVTGIGSAKKHQVQFMVTKLLGLAETPKPDDVADALAVAITHALRSGPTS